MSGYPDGNEMEQVKWPLGCIFCKTGSEEAAARLLETTPRLKRAFVPKKVEHHSEKGVKSTVKKVLFPGYVFFQAEEGWTPTLAMYHADYILRLLRTDNGWQLRGGDEELARWLLRHDGLLDLSKAYQEGTRVVIKSGPLKELEGVITKVDRHNRNGRVTLELFGRKTDVWLAFEMVEDKDAATPLESATAKE
ncbi:MAG: KOW motif-containing protein [Oscillospiraceae bacterium]|nr:KOW motif-containing protein [Oscillospiraceae bacterium]